MPKSPLKNKSSEGPPQPAPKQGREDQKSSQSAQILENLEFLVALYDEQGSAPPTSNRSFDSSEIENAVETAVQSAINETVAKTVQTAVSEAIQDSAEKTLDRLDDRFNQISQQLNEFDSCFKSLHEKIDSMPLDQASGKTESQLGVQKTELADVVCKIEDKLASLERAFQDQCKTVNGFVAKIAPAETETDVAAEPDTEETDPADDDSVSAWEQQKQAILSQPDVDSAHRPPAQTKEAEAKIADAENSFVNENSDAAKPAADTDQAEIEQLKSELVAKLREAEVEMSINRARLRQERTELERNQANFERRSAKLDAKLAAMKSEGSKSADLMARFKRHIGK